MADIFVSYSKRDKKRVTLLVKSLEAEGWDVFWDINLLSGDAWERIIRSELQKAKLVLVVWSMAAVASEWVLKEAHLARDRGVLVPVSLDGTMPPPGFGSVQAESLYWWRGIKDNAALKRAKIAISRRLYPDDKLSKTPLPDDEPLIRFRHFLAATVVGVLGTATYFFGHDPFYGELRRRDLMGVTNWGYQLQEVSPTETALLNPHDLMVIDYSKNGRVDGELTAAEVATLRRKPDGGRRLLLAYLSIGEAESYRFYWRKEWGDQFRLTKDAPKWLQKDATDWPGNFAVEYWRQDWRDILFTGADSYLDRILARGFDGVYLDRVDAFETAVTKGRSTARADMIDFIVDLASAARKKSPRFIVVPQNADSLLKDERYSGAIDGVAREDLVFDFEWIATANGKQMRQKLRSAPDIAATIDNLSTALRSGKAVFVTEYTVESAAQYSKLGLEGNGFKTVLLPRTLDRFSGYARLRQLQEDDNKRLDEKLQQSKLDAITTGKALPPPLGSTSGQPVPQPTKQ
jgi:cysteinyl-tRNA synthetase, unknown class